MAIRKVVRRASPLCLMQGLVRGNVLANLKKYVIILSVICALVLSMSLTSVSADVAPKNVPQSVSKRTVSAPRETMRFLGSASVTFANIHGELDAPSLYNLMLAAKLLNGVTLGPGNVFSFNQAVGPRTLAAGFKMGISVIGYHFVPDIGGGVCGASTVLFQAVERAGLPIVERYTHDIPVPYIAPGQDAAVWYGVQDFEFRNDLPEDVRIITHGDGDTLTVQLWEI